MHKVAPGSTSTSVFTLHYFALPPNQTLMFKMQENFMFWSRNVAADMEKRLSCCCDDIQAHLVLKNRDNHSLALVGQFSPVLEQDRS